MVSSSSHFNHFLVTKSLISLNSDREVSIASVLILESYAVPDNHISTPKPLSRYSSSESVVRSEGGGSSSSHSGSVAEKTMAFELTANLQNSVSNGSISPRHRSPAKNSLTPDHKKSNGTNDAHHETNGKNVVDKLRASSPRNATSTPVAESAVKNGFSVVESMANRSWSEIMEAESDSYS